MPHLSHTHLGSLVLSILGLARDVHQAYYIHRSKLGVHRFAKVHPIDSRPMSSPSRLFNVHRSSWTVPSLVIPGTPSGHPCGTSGGQVQRLVGGACRPLGVVPLGGLGTRPTERRRPGQRAWQHSQPRFYSRLGVRSHYSHVVVFSSPVRRSRRDAHPYQLSSACFTCPIRHRDPVHVGRARAHARLLSARVSVVPCRGMSMNVPGSIYNMTLAPHGQEHHDTAYILQSTGTITDILFGFFGFLVVDVQPRGCCQLGQLNVI